MNGLDFAPLTGRGFSLAEKTAITVSSALLLNEAKQTRFKVWGKVLGFKSDYIVAQCIGVGALSRPTTYYSVDGGENWAMLEAMATSDPRAPLCAAIQGVYMGDPAYEYRVENSNGESVAVRESERLAYFIGFHDHHCRVIPRGSQLRFEDGTIRINPNFEGLDRVAAGKLGSYVHLRKEVLPSTLLEKEGVNSNVDFLDPLTTDVPNSVWTLKYDAAQDVVYGTNLLLVGSVFYHRPGTSLFGNVYIGDGNANQDISFMM